MCYRRARGRQWKHSVSPTSHFHMEHRDNSPVPSALSEAVVSPDGSSSANLREKGEVLFLAPTSASHSVPGLLPACCSLLWLSCLVDPPGRQFKSAEDRDVSVLAQSIESAQGKVWADIAEEAKRFSPLVRRETWDKASSWYRLL